MEEYDAFIQLFQDVIHRDKIRNDNIIVGFLSERILEFLDKKSVVVHTREIYINAKGLTHLYRDSKRKRGAAFAEDDILNIPNILSDPDFVYFDTNKNKLNLLYCRQKECGNVYKIVIDTKYVHKKMGKITLLKTAGKIKYHNMKQNCYELICGKEVEER